MRLKVAFPLLLPGRPGVSAGARRGRPTAGHAVYPVQCCEPEQCCMPAVRYRVCYHTVVEEQNCVCYRPVYHTVMKECRTTCFKPCYEQHFCECRYTVCKPC